MAQRELSPNSETTHQLSVTKPEAQIRLLFEKFQAFVDEYRPKISLGGVFIATAQPKPVGTTISCEFRLADGFRLCQALGEVLWVRPQALAPHQPAGMGIRFDAIDDEGRKLILKILEEQVKTGGEPFEAERIPADVATSQEGPGPEPREDPASTHPRAATAPTPQEDPASTYSRPAAQPGSQPGHDVAGPVPGVQPIELPEQESAPAPSGAGPFDAVQPLEDFIVEPVGAEESADFNAPWGVELPGIPEDVIEPVDEKVVTASLGEDFTSDPKEAAFSAEEGDLLEMDAPAEGADLDGLPEFEVIEEGPGLAEDSMPTAAARDDLFASAEFPDFDEPLDEEAISTGPSPIGLDDTMPRSLADDGGELGMAFPSEGEVAASAAPAGFESPPMPGAVDVPLTPEDGGVSSEEWSPASAGDGLDYASGPDAGPESGPVSDFGPGSSVVDQLIGDDSKEDSWWSSDADDEWEEEAAESGFRSFLRDFQVSVAESRGRILAVVALLAILGAGLIYREQVLGLVGLGSSSEPSSRNEPAPGTAAEALTEEPAAAAEDSGDFGGESSVPAGESSEASTAGGLDADPLAADESLREAGAAELQTGSPPAPPPATRAPPPPAALDMAEATMVSNIDCGQTPQGTRCRVEFDGRLPPDRVEHHPLGYDLLKEQIVILGMGRPYRLQRIDVGTLELDRIRTGLDGERLKLVFDLSSEQMTLSSSVPRANRLEINVSRRR